MTIHLVIPDQHAHYEHSNERADWLSKLIIDIRPDIVINIGDSADMPSLAGYDKGKRSFQGRTYKQDINAHLDFQHRIWEPIKARKKRLPRRIFCIGNHEDRITRAIESQPELDGAIGLSDLQLGEFYDEVIGYSGKDTPGQIIVDGICYAHYVISGISGRALSSEHQAFSLLAKNFQSTTVGHNHLFDYSIRTGADGRKIMGLSVGCYQDYDSDWAGERNRLWTKGVAIKRNVHQGSYDLQWISLEALRNEYAT